MRPPHAAARRDKLIAILALLYARARFRLRAEEKIGAFDAAAPARAAA